MKVKMKTSGAGSETPGQATETGPLTSPLDEMFVESEQNIYLAILGGTMAAITVAGIWAAIAVNTKHPIGWMAIVVGVMVGLAVRLFGKGESYSFGIVGAVCTLVGCYLGDLMTVCGYVADQHSVKFIQIFIPALQQPSFAMQLLKGSFGALDLVVYVIAVAIGVRLSFRSLAPGVLSRLIGKGS